MAYGQGAYSTIEYAGTSTSSSQTFTVGALTAADTQLATLTAADTPTGGPNG